MTTDTPQNSLRPHTWTFRGRCERVVDGDTLDVVVDLGFNSRTVQRLRLAGVDTAEIHTVEEGSDEWERGTEQAHWVADWIQSVPPDIKWPLLVETRETGKYGRYLATVAPAGAGQPTLNAELASEFDV